MSEGTIEVMEPTFSPISDPRPTAATTIIGRSAQTPIRIPGVRELVAPLTTTDHRHGTQTAHIAALVEIARSAALVGIVHYLGDNDNLQFN